MCTYTKCVTDEFCLKAARDGISCVSCAGTMQAAVKVDGKEISVTKNNVIIANELNAETVILSLIILVIIGILLVMLIRHFMKKCEWTNWQYKDISESTDIDNSTVKTTINMDHQVDSNQNEKKFQNVVLM